MWTGKKTTPKAWASSGFGNLGAGNPGNRSFAGFAGFRWLTTDTHVYFAGAGAIALVLVGHKGIKTEVLGMKD